MRKKPELTSNSGKFNLRFFWDEAPLFQTIKGFGLKQLAALTGLSASYINEIEKGKKYPKAEKIMMLAE